MTCIWLIGSAEALLLVGLEQPWQFAGLCPAIQLNADLYDIFSFTADGKSQLLSRWWALEPNVVEKTPHLDRKNPLGYCSALHERQCVWAPSSNTCLYSQHAAQPPWASLLVSGKMYGARSLSLFSHYSYLPISTILSLSLHWQITRWVLLHTPGRQIFFQIWHLLLQDDWQCLPGRDGITPVHHILFHHTSMLSFIGSMSFSWNTMSSLWYMWGFFHF